MLASPVRQGTAAPGAVRGPRGLPAEVLLNAHTDGPTGPDDHPLVDDGTADVISYGALFIANPDLPARLRANGPFNTPDPSTFFGRDTNRYVDYPALDTVRS